MSTPSKGSYPNFASNNKQIFVNWLISIPVKSLENIICLNSGSHLQKNLLLFTSIEVF